MGLTSKNDNDDSDSQENLVNLENGSVYSLGGVSLVESPSEIILTQAEREYLLYVQRGDIASVKRQLKLYENNPQELDIDCLDPLRRSAVAIAIENENLELVDILLQLGVKPKDALLHAISEEYVEGVELLLHFEEERHVPGEPYSWEMMPRETAKFTQDITPLILAAHYDHYEILKILLDRGATIPMPHDIRCGCDECLSSTEEDSLRHSLSRINAYKALASPSLISLSSKDPILTSFELSSELVRLESIEHEFREEYSIQNGRVMKFSTDIIDQVRTKKELATVLNYDPKGDVWVEGEVHSLERLKSAIKYSQKDFVAHPNVQQLLGAIWYDGLPGFKRKAVSSKCLEIAKIACMFPVFSLIYIINSESARGKLMKKPFVKFLCNCASYMFFLMLLALASQRIEYLLIEWFGNAWLRELLEDWKIRERGSLPGVTEMLIVIYVLGLIWAEIQALWTDGLLEYIQDLWNIVDYITNMFYVAWIFLRATSWILVHRDLWLYDEWPWYPREEWHSFDPMLISEGCFGAAMIFSFLKLINIFSVNPHLGPLQISLGRMIFDILKFFFLYSLVLFAFGCGLNQLLWYYAELEMHTCYHLPGGIPDYYNNKQSCMIWRRFANLFESSQSLFWASFGLVELGNFDLGEVGSFTRFWSLLMFGSYSVINVIVLLNLLIAMMSNSYQIISERSDTEWKFARTRLWLSYFEDGATVPPPFNLIPSAKCVQRFLGISRMHPKSSGRKKSSRRKADIEHQNVMRLLVRRYITERQRSADEKPVTEDDINEVKQDISTFRYELIDVLKKNGMNISYANNDEQIIVGKRGRAIERKLMKGFNIGLVEGIVNEVLTGTKKSANIFGNLAKAFKKKHKTDWNAKVSRASIRVKDQIGSSETSLKRRQLTMRRRVMENDVLLNSMNPDNIAEYNPNLEDYTPATRVAYAKFKVNTLKAEKEKKKKQEKERELKEKTDKANAILSQEREDKIEYRSPTPRQALGKGELNADEQNLKLDQCVSEPKKNNSENDFNLNSSSQKNSLEEDDKHCTGSHTIFSDVEVHKADTDQSNKTLDQKAENNSDNVTNKINHTMAKPDQVDKIQDISTEPTSQARSKITHDVKRESIIDDKKKQQDTQRNQNKKEEKAFEATPKQLIHESASKQPKQKDQEALSPSKPEGEKDSKKPSINLTVQPKTDEPAPPTGKSMISGQVRTGWL